MLVRHNTTGDLYKVLFKSFSVERQAVSIIYTQIKTGYIFDRDLDAFEKSFNVVDYAPQFLIEPREDPNQHKLKL